MIYGLRYHEMLQEIEYILKYISIKKLFQQIYFINYYMEIIVTYGKRRYINQRQHQLHWNQLYNFFRSQFKLNVFHVNIICKIKKIKSN